VWRGIECTAVLDSVSEVIRRDTRLSRRVLQAANFFESPTASSSQLIQVAAIMTLNPVLLASRTLRSQQKSILQRHDHVKDNLRLPSEPVVTNHKSRAGGSLRLRVRGEHDGRR